jgi:hypothetical protein
LGLLLFALPNFEQNGLHLENEFQNDNFYFSFSANHLLTTYLPTCGKHPSKIALRKTLDGMTDREKSR